MPQRLSAFRLPEDIIEGLQNIKQRDGIPISEQVRRALAGWLRRKKGFRAPTRGLASRRPRDTTRA